LLGELGVSRTKCCPADYEDAEGQTLPRLNVVDAAVCDDHGE
jgi:hypothetical protein